MLRGGDGDGGYGAQDGAREGAPCLWPGLSNPALNVLLAGVSLLVVLPSAKCFLRI